MELVIFKRWNMENAARLKTARSLDVFGSESRRVFTLVNEARSKRTSRAGKTGPVVADLRLKSAKTLRL